MPVRDFVLLAFFVVSVPICFFRPFYGIIMWVIVAFLNPQSYIWKFGEDFPWGLTVAVATIGGCLLFGASWSALKSREVGLLMILWGWFLVSTVVSVNTPALMHHAADTLYRFNFTSKILLMTVLMVAIVNTFQRLRNLVIVVACCFGFFVAKAFPFVIITGGAFRVYGPNHSMIADNNDLGLALNMTMPMFFFLAQSERKMWVKAMFLALFLMTIPVIFFTYSRGALIGLLSVFICFITFMSLRQRMILVPAIALGLVMSLTFAPDSWRHRMDPTREDAVDASAQARLNAWAYCRNLAMDYPITGGGFATFTPELFALYAPSGFRAISPHSVYFQLLAEHGFVGLGIYLLLVLSCFLKALQIGRAARIRGDGVVQKYASMFRFSLVGFLVSGIFLGRAYFDFFFFMVSCLAILQRVAAIEWARAERESKEEAQDAEVEVFYGGGPTLAGEMP